LTNRWPTLAANETVLWGRDQARDSDGQLTVGFVGSLVIVISATDGHLL
jgi:hypothetical protein